MKRFILLLKFYLICLLKRILGISFIVKYLRNPDPQLTVKILRYFGAGVGNKTTIKRSVYFDNVYGDKNSTNDFSHLTIGTNCYIGDGVYFDLADEIIIGDHAVVSARASFTTHSDCNRSPILKEIFPRVCKKTVIQDGAWVGFGATVLCGVTVGAHAVVAACALVRRNVDAFCVYGGVPAHRIRVLKESTQQRSLEN